MGLEEVLLALLRSYGAHLVLSALRRLVAADANGELTGCAMPPPLFDRDELGLDPEDDECPG